MKKYLIVLSAFLLASCATVPPSKEDKNNSFEGNFKMYSFKLYRGAKIQDNIQRLAKITGYQVHTADIKPGCDVFTESYTVKEWSVDQMFKTIAGDDFQVTFHESGTPNQMVVLRYIGKQDKLVGCYK